MKPGHRHELEDPIEDSEADAAHSGMRPKRLRVDPRIDGILDAARAGRVTEEEALNQIEQVMLETFGAELEPAARIGAAAALRRLRDDPRFIAILREDDNE